MVISRYFLSVSVFFCFFFFNDTATTEIYTLSLHDALPISPPRAPGWYSRSATKPGDAAPRSEEHTSELQSHVNLVCRLLLEKKKIQSLSLASLGTWGSRQFAVGPTLSLPIFEGGRLTGTLQLRKAQQQEAALLFQK